MPVTLADRRILVVGASSGIGRAAGLRLAAAGARVAFAARRLERIEEAAKEAGARSLALRCDVREPADCEALVARAVESFGGLDALVYTAGILALRAFEDSDPEVWRDIFETNVHGAARVTRAVLPHLARARGRALYVSSISASQHPPRSGLAAYISSKAALEKLVECLEVEHTEIAFTRVVVGDTLTEAGRHLTPEGIARYFPDWERRSLFYGRAMDAGQAAQAIEFALRAEEHVPIVTLLPRRTGRAG